MKKILKPAALLCAALLLLATAACGEAPRPAPDATAAAFATPDNDILTFADNSDGRPIVLVGTQYYNLSPSFIELLEETYPDYLFVYDYSLTAGLNSEQRFNEYLNSGRRYDLLISASSISDEDKPLMFADLSEQPFLDKYLLSSLRDVSTDGRIYTIPSVSALSGIAFNATMFAEHGWEIPRDREEFFALCETIREAGVTPFSTNFKYATQLSRCLSTMCYASLFNSVEAIEWIEGVWAGTADYAGFIEPMYELAKRFADTGVVTLDDFSASLTKQRLAFWAGEYAMIEYDSGIFDYAESENAPFEVGIMPFPAEDARDSGFSVRPESYFSIPKYVEEDPERMALMLDILSFISSQEAQSALLEGGVSISNVRGIVFQENEVTKYVIDAYNRGALYPFLVMPYDTAQMNAVRTLFEGATVQEAVALMDTLADQAFADAQAAEAPSEPQVIATAEESFTVLEASWLLADLLRETTGADVGVMVNDSFFKANLTSIPAGDITDLSRFVMKGVAAEDYLTTYSLTGAQLKALLERPVINGVELDALVAASGLAMEYAPWNERGNRVISVTLEDGTALEPDKLYTVAAWAGVIDPQYVTETLEVFDGLGGFTDVLQSALSARGSVRPDIQGRLTLVWPESK